MPDSVEPYGKLAEVRLMNEAIDVIVGNVDEAQEALLAINRAGGHIFIVKPSISESPGTRLDLSIMCHSKIDGHILDVSFAAQTVVCLLRYGNHAKVHVGKEIAILTQVKGELKIANCVRTSDFFSGISLNKDASRVVSLKMNHGRIECFNARNVGSLILKS